MPWPSIAGIAIYPFRRKFLPPVRPQLADEQEEHSTFTTHESSVVTARFGAIGSMDAAFLTISQTQTQRLY